MVKNAIINNLFKYIHVKTQVYPTNIIYKIKYVTFVPKSAYCVLNLASPNKLVVNEFPSTSPPSKVIFIVSDPSPPIASQMDSVIVSTNDII